MSTTITLTPITIKGEEALRRYIAYTEEYARTNAKKIKFRMVAKMQERISTEEYFENPLRLIVTLKNDVNLEYRLPIIESKLRTVMSNYGVSETDYKIEVQ